MTYTTLGRYVTLAGNFTYYPYNMTRVARHNALG
jgi:hypothetical protein